MLLRAALLCSLLLYHEAFYANCRGVPRRWSPELNGGTFQVYLVGNGLIQHSYLTSSENGLYRMTGMEVKCLCSGS
jgi:hypothetical protein